MEVALRRGYGYAFGPKIHRRAGYGMQGLGDTCTSYDDDGDCLTSVPDTTPTVALDLTCPSGQISDGAGGCIYTSLTTPVTAPSANTITDQYGSACTVSQWDAINNLCPGSAGYSASAPGVSTGTPSQIAAALTAAAAAATAIAKGVTGGSIQCGNGTAVPVGTSCPGAPVGSVCPSGLTLSGTTCVTGVLGMSTSTLLMIGVVLFAVFALEGKK